jgi:hypothetical protein
LETDTNGKTKRTQTELTCLKRIGFGLRRVRSGACDPTVVNESRRGRDPSLRTEEPVVAKPWTAIELL